MTYRPKNGCGECEYTWHPRGKNRSLNCPRCGSRHIIEYETRYTTDWWPLKFLLIFFVSLFIGIKAHEAKIDILEKLAWVGILGSGAGFVISYQED